MPDEPEVFGLLALMEFAGLAASPRALARMARSCRSPQQNRARWDRLLIRRGLAALARAEALGGADRTLRACRRRSPPAMPMPRPPQRPTGYGSPASTTRCATVTPSPVVDLNRAVAHSMAFGPERGLALIAEIERGGGAADLSAAAGGEGRFPVARRPAR